MLVRCRGAEGWLGLIELENRERRISPDIHSDHEEIFRAVRENRPPDPEVAKIDLERAEKVRHPHTYPVPSSRNPALFLPGTGFIP